MRRRDTVRAAIALTLAAMLAWTPVAIAQPPDDLLDRLEAGDRLRITLRADRVSEGETAAIDAVYVARDATSLRVRVDGLERGFDVWFQPRRSRPLFLLGEKAR